MVRFCYGLDNGMVYGLDYVPCNLEIPIRLRTHSISCALLTKLATYIPYIHQF